VRSMSIINSAQEIRNDKKLNRKGDSNTTKFRANKVEKSCRKLNSIDQSEKQSGNE
jgi:hypothetical protein